MRLVSFGPLVCFFLCFWILTNFFYYLYVLSTYSRHEVGSDNTSRPKVCFFILKSFPNYLVTYLMTLTMETNKERGTSPVPVTNPPSTKRNGEMTGDVGRWNKQKTQDTSNDMSWAVGMFFFSFSFIILLLTRILATTTTINIHNDDTMPAQWQHQHYTAPPFTRGGSFILSQPRYHHIATMPVCHHQSPSEDDGNKGPKQWNQVSSFWP